MQHRKGNFVVQEAVKNIQCLNNRYYWVDICSVTSDLKVQCPRVMLGVKNCLIYLYLHILPLPLSHIIGRDACQARMLIEIRRDRRLKDYTVKPDVSGHSKRRPKLIFKTDYHLMQVKSIAECSKGSILQYFQPSLSYRLSLRPLFRLILSGRLRQVLL